MKQAPDFLNRQGGVALRVRDLVVNGWPIRVFPGGGKIELSVRSEATGGG